MCPSTPWPIRFTSSLRTQTHATTPQRTGEEDTTLGSMPRWGTCHAEEHADRSPWITYHFNALQMRHTFHHAANTPQLHLRNASALTHNRFFLYRRHIQILGSSSLLYDSSGPSTARKICGPHQYSRTRIRSTVQATS